MPILAEAYTDGSNSPVDIEASPLLRVGPLTTGGTVTTVTDNPPAPATRVVRLSVDRPSGTRAETEHEQWVGATESSTRLVQGLPRWYRYWIRLPSNWGGPGRIGGQFGNERQNNFGQIHKQGGTVAPGCTQIRGPVFNLEFVQSGANTNNNVPGPEYLHPDPVGDPFVFIRADAKNSNDAGGQCNEDREIIVLPVFGPNANNGTPDVMTLRGTWIEIIWELNFQWQTGQVRVWINPQSDNETPIFDSNNFMTGWGYNLTSPAVRTGSNYWGSGTSGQLLYVPNGGGALIPSPVFHDVCNYAVGDENSSLGEMRIGGSAPTFEAFGFERRRQVFESAVAIESTGFERRRVFFDAEFDAEAPDVISPVRCGVDRSFSKTPVDSPLMVFEFPALGNIDPQPERTLVLIDHTNDSDPGLVMGHGMYANGAEAALSGWSRSGATNTVCRTWGFSQNSLVNTPIDGTLVTDLSQPTFADLRDQPDSLIEYDWTGEGAVIPVKNNASMLSGNATWAASRVINGALQDVEIPVTGLWAAAVPPDAVFVYQMRDAALTEPPTINNHVQSSWGFASINGGVITQCSTTVGSANNNNPPRILTRVSDSRVACRCNNTNGSIQSALELTGFGNGELTFTQRDGNGTTDRYLISAFYAGGARCQAGVTPIPNVATLDLDIISGFANQFVRGVASHAVAVDTPILGTVNPDAGCVSVFSCVPDTPGWDPVDFGQGNISHVTVGYREGNTSPSSSSTNTKRIHAINLQNAAGADAVQSEFKSHLLNGTRFDMTLVQPTQTLLTWIAIEKAPPSITSLVPNIGPAGTVVTINGRDLSLGTTITVNGSTPGNVPDFIDDTKATFEMPGGFVGPTTVTITTPSGESNALQFTETVPAPFIFED